MEGFREIFSTNNPIQVTQIEHAFKKAEIRHIVKGKKALEIGSIELTGIRGAQVFVDELQFRSAKEILNSLDIDTEEGKESSFNYIYLLGSVFLAILIYMVYKAYFTNY